MPFYTVGGPTTHFAGQGVSDPFVEAGHGNKKVGLLRSGLTPENWMLEYAKGVQEKNMELAKERRERLGRIREGFWYEKEVKGEGEEASSAMMAGGSKKGKERADGAGLAGANSYAPSPLGGSARATPAREVSAAAADGDEEMSGVVEEGAEGGRYASPLKKRKRSVAGPPVGVYDPHTHITHGE